jgi:hypothetical protein
MILIYYSLKGILSRESPYRPFEFLAFLCMGVGMLKIYLKQKRILTSPGLLNTFAMFTAVSCEHYCLGVLKTSALKRVQVFLFLKKPSRASKTMFISYF